MQAPSSDPAPALPAASAPPAVPESSRLPGTAAGAPGRAELALLALALALGLLRFHRLGEWSLWLDEAYTLADAHHGERNYNPLGYWLVRRTYELLSGSDEWRLRFLPALAGWLAIPLSWWAFRPLAGGRRAVAVALLVALSSWEIHWSQTARFYTLVGIPSLLGTGAVLRGVVAGRAGGVVAGLVLIALGVTLHLQAALLAAALALGVLVLARAERREGRALRRTAAQRSGLAVLALGALGALLVGPWAWGVFERYRDVKATSPLASVVHLSLSTVSYLTPTLSIAAGLGALVAWARRRVEPGGLLVVASALAAFGGTMAAALLARGTAQYVFVIMPTVALLAVWPLGGEHQPIEPLGRSVAGRAAYLALLALTLLASTMLYFLEHHGERSRWRDAYRYVAAERAADDLVLGMEAPVGERTLDPSATDLRRPTRVASLDMYNPQLWLRWAERPRPMWIVVRPDFLQEWPERDRAELVAFLQHDCHLRRRFDVHLEGRDLDVEVYYRP